MTTLTNSRGEVIDLTTGETIGRAEGAPITASARSPRVETAVPEGDRVSGLVNNLSWGFNSALFALPDAATLAIGRGLGLKEDEVFTLGKFFNKGAAPARNTEERYARAIGEGIGGTMPFTGILAYLARTRPMVTTAQTVKTGVLKGVADDAIKFVQRNPKSAAAIDIAFGAGYEGLRQAVTENVSDENPNKQLYEELLPMGAFVGLPVAMNFLPSVMAGKAINNKIKSATSGLGDTGSDEVLASLAGPWQLPIVRVFPGMLKKKAESKLAQVFGPLENSKEAQEALRQLDLAMQDPRFAQAGFLFNVAEERMTPELSARTAELMQQLGPKELAEFKNRINENQQKFAALMDSIAPEARQPVAEAFRAAQAERQSLFDSLLTAQKDLTEAERAAVAERLGPQNMDMINNELRGALMGAMEFDYKMRDNVLRRMGLRQATSNEGLPMPTREEGASLFPSQDMEAAANGLVQKYTPERPSLRTPIPEPIAFLRNFLQSQEVARQRLEAKMLSQLTDDAIGGQIEALGLPPDIADAVRSEAMKLFQPQRKKGKKATAADVVKMSPTGEVSIPVGSRKITLNPNQIKEDAVRIAEENTKVDINLPEALDYLAAAARFRNDALNRYNAAMSKGGTRLTDAQRILDTGNAVYKDIEKLILDHVPKIGREYEAMNSILSDYRAGFEQSLPLLMSQKRMRGDEYLIGNEEVMKRAFSSGNNLRQLQTTLGGTPGFDDMLMKGTIDWLRSKNVVNENGLVDPKKIRSVLDKNRNIVESLPDTVRAQLDNEVALADDYVKRMGELEDRRIIAKNDELDSLLRKVGRPDADPKQTLAKAIQDPATMRVLVDELGKDPERLAALRRSVFDIAGEGALQGGALKTFLDNNQKSLRVLFKDTGHFDDLVKLADMQRRVNAFADVTGQIPAFDSLDQVLRKTFGAGIQFLTTTAREAAVGRIRPETGLLAIGVRLAGALENEIYQKVFLKALADPAFAKNLNSVTTPAQAQKVVAGLESIGIPRSVLIPPRIMAEEASRAAIDEEELPNMREAPVVPRGTAAEMLRALPPAPPTMGYNLRVPTAPMNRPSIAQNVPLMYPTLFPNDPISGMLEQRRQAAQQGQVVPPQMPPQR